MSQQHDLEPTPTTELEKLQIHGQKSTPGYLTTSLEEVYIFRKQKGLQNKFRAPVSSIYLMQKMECLVVPFEAKYHSCFEKRQYKHKNCK